MRRTPLYTYHAKHAKMAEFAGFEMPLYYTSAVKEALAVREKAGLFDVSHMGVIEVLGLNAETFLNLASTNLIAGKKEGSATYTTLANERGGCIDDVLVMRLSRTRFLVVANAINRETVLAHLKEGAFNFDKLAVAPLYEKAGFLAIQGKEAESIIARLMPDAKALEKYTLASFFHLRFGELIISRTGYTGEDGFEILVDNEIMLQVWQEILGFKNIVPCGLAARDILRLEMGYALYGHELSLDISPIESVSHWTVKLTKEFFIGKEALLAKSKESHRVEQGLILNAGGVMREGFNIYKDDALIGKITSGGFSPTLNKSIAIALLSQKLPEGEEVFVEIRGRKEPARINKLPFLNK